MIRRELSNARAAKSPSFGEKYNKLLCNRVMVGSQYVINPTPTANAREHYMLLYKTGGMVNVNSQII